MSRFVLGPEGARKFRELCAAKSAGKRRGGGGPSPVFAVEFPAPYTVKWAASLASDETSEGAGDGTDGEWIIWLPTSGLLKVGQASVDITSDLDDAGGDYPEGWYKLGEALDRDEGGTLYLNVTVGNTPSAEFSDTAGSASNPVAVKICEASVDSETGARTVMQFVSSVIVVGATGEDRDTITVADERSTSRAYAGNGSEGVQHCNILSIYGFGRFHDEDSNVRGFFSPSSNVEISEYDHTAVAFLARSGNTDVVDGNMVAYRKVKIKSVAEPFKFTETITTDPETGDPVVTRALVNCQFFMDGSLVTVGGGTVAVAAANATYYLHIVGTENAQTGAITWTGTVDTSASSSTQGVKNIDVPLYHIGNDFRPDIDYRAATLSFSSGAGGADGDGKSIGKVPDAAEGETPTGDEGKLEIKGFSAAAADTVPAKGAGGSVLWKAIKSLILGTTTIGKIVADQNATIKIKTISAGKGISVKAKGDTVVISLASDSTGDSSADDGYTGERTILKDVDYNPSTHELRRRYIAETWLNGRMVDQTLLPWEAYHQAVEES